MPSNSRSLETPRWYFTSPEPSTSSGFAEPPLNSWKSARYGFHQHVGQHVQPAAMRHAEHDLLHAELAAALDDLLQRRDRRLGAFQAEALRAGVFLVEELLQAFRLDELGQDRLLAEVAERDLFVQPLDALLNPLLLLRRGDVHELVADGAAIGAAHDLDDLPQRRGFEAQHIIDVDLMIEVGRGEAVGRRLELGMRARRRKVQGIEVADQVSIHAVGADQHQGADGLARGPEGLLAADLDALLLGLGA